VAEIYIRIGRIAVIQRVPEGPDVALDSICKSRDGTSNVNSAGRVCLPARAAFQFSASAAQHEVMLNGKFAC
jgi:hypothetical protein